MKPKTLLTIRRIVQFLFFVFFVVFALGAVCAFSLDGEKQAFSCTVGTLQVLISGTFIMWSLIISGLVMIVLTILLGRVFCSWMCPFGAVIDWLEQLIKRTHIKRSEKAHNVIVNPTSKYGVLAGVAVAAGVAGKPVFCAVCPIGNTCRAAGMQGVMLGLESLVIPVFAGLSFIKERFWCRYLCPVGAVLALTDKVSFLRIKLPAGTCVRCKRCENACPMAVEPWTNTHKQLKEDPAVLEALMEKGLPDVLCRPVPLKTLDAEVQGLLESKTNHKKIPGGECIRCFECAACCPLLNETKEKPADVAAEKPLSA